jgi:hypothetical protein
MGEATSRVGVQPNSMDDILGGMWITHLRSQIGNTVYSERLAHCKYSPHFLSRICNESRLGWLHSPLWTTRCPPAPLSRKTSGGV